LRDPNARFRWLDFDRNGPQVLGGLIHFDPKTGQPRDPALVASCIARLSIHVLYDDIRMVDGNPTLVGTPHAFPDLGRKLTDWGEGIGNMNSWDANDWLIIDSNTAMGEAALRYVLFRKSRMNKRPEQSDWGEAIEMVGKLYEAVCDPSLRANVIIITHTRWLGDREAGEDEKGNAKELIALPNALGQKMPNEIGRYFNNLWEARTVGVGPGMRRQIFTRSAGRLELKTSSPGTVKPSYDIDKFFDLISDLRRGMGTVPALPAAAQGAVAPSPSLAATAPPPPAGPKPASPPSATPSAPVQQPQKG
jgi:hypothetical protein